MEYSYDYSALQRFMATHRLQKKDVLEAIGITDYVTINKWLDGKVPIHVTAMLRFCNYYNVPVTMFFVDGDAMPQPAYPDKDTQLLPTDNYGMEGGRGRGIVETIITERNVTSPEQAKVVSRGLARQAEQRNLRDRAISAMRQQAKETQSNTETATINDRTLTESILRLQLDQANDLRSIEQRNREREDALRERWEKERERLLSIIEQQSLDISRLASGHKQATKIQYIEHEMPPMMVAEDIAEYGKKDKSSY